MDVGRVAWRLDPEEVWFLYPTKLRFMTASLAIPVSAYARRMRQASLE